MINAINFVMRWFTKNIIKPVFGSLVIFDLLVFIYFVALTTLFVILVIKYKKQKGLIRLKNEQIEDLTNRLKKRERKKKSNTIRKVQNER